jgi:hypothetical protein
MSLNDASLFIQSSSIAGWEKSRFLPFPYRNCTLGRLRHFSTTRNVRKDKEEGIILTWKKKKKKSCVERNERAAIHLILFAEGGGGAMRHAMPVLSKAARRISLASKANKGHHFLILFDCFVQWITRQNPSLDPTSLSTIRFAFESEA